MGRLTELTRIRHIEQCRAPTELSIALHSVRQHYPDHQCSIVHRSNGRDILSPHLHYEITEQNFSHINKMFLGAKWDSEDLGKRHRAVSLLPCLCQSSASLHTFTRIRMVSSTQQKWTDVSLFTLHSLPSYPSFRIQRHTFLLFCPKWLKRCQ